MSETSDVQTDTSPPGLPPHVRRLIAPWWEARAARLCVLLEAADNTGETTVSLDGRRVTVEHLTEMARYAIEMVERLETKACT